jgi:hypothetical protein|tara:strand:- start:155 stop:871 length:717 start_codon:yes stop_codon:yes gene_type:complete
MIFRTTHHADYTVIPNRTLQGGCTKSRKDGLTPEALGVLAYLLSHPTDWQVTNAAIAQHFGVTTDRITKITKCLAAAGYIRRAPVRKDGKLQAWDWDVLDQIPENLDPEKPDLENQDLEIPDQEKRGTKKVIFGQSNIKTKTVTLSEAIGQTPAGVPRDAFATWIQYRIGRGHTIGKQKLTLAINQFKTLKDAGLQDWDRAVKIATDANWQSISPEYSGIKQLCGSRATSPDILSRVK